MTKKQSARAIGIALMVGLILLTATLPAAAQEPTPVLSVTYSNGSTTQTSGTASGPTWQFNVTHAGSVASAQVTMPDGTVIVWDGQNGANLADPCSPGGGTASWHWVLAGGHNLTISDATCAPLSVVLNDFAASCQVDEIIVTWETGSEIDNLGFNLIRGVEGLGTTVEIWFVPSQSPGGTSGASYSFNDANVEVGQSYAYSLESVDLAGGTVRYGPAFAGCEVPSAVKISNFNATTGVVRPPGCMGYAALGLGALGFVLFQSRRRRSKF